MRTGTAARPVRADDSAVIEASQTDPEAFAELFDRHARVIHRYIARRLGHQIAEDVVAETFLVAFRRRDRYEPAQADARPWLYGIATHLISQHRRDESRQFRLGQVAAPVSLVEPGHEDRVAGDVTAEAVRGALANALDGLPDIERDVLLLIAWEQLSYAETASALGVPIGTVRSRLNRARLRVREALATTGLSATFREILSNE
jgi:RNA polymerase sigma factor (sigma-70 family)